jgi:LmbE family N-acetylglucosaminyl deacetylase
MQRALCIVAHPDDCVIFGYHFILGNRQYRWTILYLILDNDSPRVEEMRGYWGRHSIEVSSLELPHDPPPADLTNGRCSIPSAEARSAVEEATHEYDLILTHGEGGEYGHPHHIFLHGIIRELGREFIAFDVGPTAPLRFSMPRDHDGMLPLHRRAIRRFVRQFGLEMSAGYRLESPR